jgi:cytochrome P450
VFVLTIFCFIISLNFSHTDGSTASTLSFALWELAKDVDLQQRLRQEIKETLRRVQANGETEIGFDEYDNMSLLVAFIKVSRKLYSSIIHKTSWRFPGSLEVASR